MKKKIITIPSIEERIQELLRNFEIEESLELVYQTVAKLAVSRDLRGRYVHLESLDNVLVEISRLIKNFRAKNLKIRSPKLCEETLKKPAVLIIGTEFYLHGGHTRIAERMNFEDSVKCDVILTDIFNTYKKSPDLFHTQKEIFKFRSFQHLHSQYKKEMILELWSMIDELSPKKICVIAHHEDVVAYTALAELGIEVEYIHHCDHRPTLGATIKTFEHTDVTLELQKICSIYINKTPRFRPLLTIDYGYILKKSRDSMTTVSCGSAHKFSHSVPVTYGEVVASTIGFTGGVHYHIGSLPDAFREKIRLSLIEKKIDPKLFKYIPWVRSLAEILLKLNPSCLIASFPESGGTTVLEAQSTGTPVIYYYNEDVQPEFLRISSIYASHDLRWSNLHEFLDALRKLTKGIDGYSFAARKFYESYRVSGYYPSLDQKQSEK